MGTIENMCLTKSNQYKSKINPEIQEDPTIQFSSDLIEKILSMYSTNTEEHPIFDNTKSELTNKFQEMRKTIDAQPKAFTRVKDYGVENEFDMNLHKKKNEGSISNN